MTDRMQQVLDNLRRQIGDSQWDGFVEACYDAFGKYDQLDGENAVLFEQVQSLSRENAALKSANHQLEKANEVMRERHLEVTEPDPDGRIVVLKDADDVPVHIGDVMVGPYLEPAPVDGVGEGVFFVHKGDDVYYGYDASCYSHYHQPESWERIIDDAELLARDWFNTDMSENEHAEGLDALVARCKALCERTNCGDAE